MKLPYGAFAALWTIDQSHRMKVAISLAGDVNAHSERKLPGSLGPMNSGGALILDRNLEVLSLFPCEV